MNILDHIRIALKNLLFGKERDIIGEYPEDNDTESYELLEEPVKDMNDANFKTTGYTNQWGLYSNNLRVSSIVDVKKNTAILMPVANRIEPQVEDGLKQLEKIGFTVYRQTGYSAIDQARNRMMYYALEQYGHDSVLWIDSDVVFNVNDVVKIINHNLPICAGAYPFKNPHTRQMTITMIDDEEIEFGNNKLVEIQCAATGFLFITKEVYHSIIEKYNMPLCNTSFDQPCYPVFKPDNWLIDGVDYYLGEDYSFCMRARECGYKIILDPSIKLGHIGSYVYSWEDVCHGVKPEVKSFKFKNNNHKHSS